MKREEKQVIINSIAEQLKSNQHFYLTDINSLNAAETFELRKECFEKNIELIVVKNTLLRKAFEQFGDKYNELTKVLNGNTSIMLTNTGNAPAKMIKKFRENHDKPILKGAYVEESVYLGEQSLDALVNLKSKNELIADVILLLQSPMRNVLSSLQSGANNIHGILKTLSEK
jgi:large subunit ribosomal protein L10